MSDTVATQLAIHGGPKAVTTNPGDLFDWMITTSKDEEAVLEVLRRGAMSAWDVTLEFERELAAWFGSEHALCFNNGTQAIRTAMWACGVHAGDEIICQSMTFWASALQVYSLGGTVVFAEMDPATLTLDPEDVERRITDRTKAIVCVHYCGYPTDMDAIMEIAARRHIMVIEDVSHAQGGLYKGRKLGTIGHVGAMSIMSEKSLACGEGGVLITGDDLLHQRAVAFGHYERPDLLTNSELAPFAKLPMGGYKNRIHQMSAAVGRVQLRAYADRMDEIQRAMNHFWDLLEGVPGVHAHRPPAASGSTMGGWYYAHGIYAPEELGGLPLSRFCEALNAEGVPAAAGANFLLHLHPMLNDADVYGHGKPTRIAHSDRDLRQPAGSLPVSESLPERTFSVPWFKHYRPDIIAAYAAGVRKVAEAAGEL